MSFFRSFKKLSEVAKQVLYSVLVVQLAVMPLPRAQQADSHHQVFREESPQAQLRSVTSTLLHLTAQERRVLDLDGTRIESHSLTEVNFMMPEVVFQSLAEVGYAVVEGELRIRIKNDKNILEHAIGEVGALTAAPVQTGNFVVFATDRGTFVLPARLVQGQMFNAPIPLLRLAAMPPHTRITKIEVLNIDTAEHRAWLRGFSEDRLVFNGDLMMDIESTKSQGQVETTKLLVPRDQLVMSIRDQLITFLLFNAILNRSEKSSPYLVELLERHQQRLMDMIKTDAGGIEEALGDREALVEVALNRFAKNGRSVLEAVLAPRFDRASGSFQPSAFDSLAEAKRLGQSVGSLQSEIADEVFVASASYMRNSAWMRLLGSALVKAKSMGPRLLLRGNSILTGALGLSKGLVTSKLVQTFIGGTALTAGSLYLSSPEETMTALLSLMAHLSETYATIAGYELDVQKAANSLGATADKYSGYWWAATLGVLGILPFFLYISRLIPTRSGQEAGLFQKAFEVGTSVLARLNNVIPNLLENRLRQKLLYSSMGQGLGPSFNSPLASADELAQKAETLQAKLQLRDTGNQIGSYITALIAANAAHNERVRQTGQGNFVDITTLFMADKVLEQVKDYRESGVEQKSVTMLDLLNDPGTRKLWDALYPTVNELIWTELQKQSTGVDVDKTTVETIMKRLNLIQKEINDIREPKISSLLREQWTHTRRLFKHQVVNYFLGERWRSFSLKWRHPYIDERTSKVTAMAIGPDFVLSMAMFGGLFPDTVQDLLKIALGEQTLESLPAERREKLLLPYTMGFEQVALVSSVGPIGAAQGHGATDLSEAEYAATVNRLLETPNLWEKLSLYLMGRPTGQQQAAAEVYGDPNMIPQQKTESFFTGVGKIAKSLVKNPDIYLKEHAHYIEKLAGDAIPGYLLITAPFIGIAFTGSTAFALGWDALTANPAMISAAVTMGLVSNFVILLAKYSFAGYAWLWPYAHTMTHLAFEMIDHNRAQFNEALYWLDRGIRGQEKASLIAGVERLKAFYEVGRQPLPEAYTIAADQFTPELAKSFIRYSFENMPIPTLQNKKLSFYTINVGFLTVGTTLLYYMVYSGVLQVSSVFKNEGAAAAFAAFGDLLMYKAALPLIATYALARFGPQLASKETRGRVKEAVRNSWRSWRGKPIQPSCRGVF